MFTKQTNKPFFLRQQIPTTQSQSREFDSKENVSRLAKEEDRQLQHLNSHPLNQTLQRNRIELPSLHVMRRERLDSSQLRIQAAIKQDTSPSERTTIKVAQAISRTFAKAGIYESSGKGKRSVVTLRPSDSGIMLGGSGTLTKSGSQEKLVNVSIPTRKHQINLQLQHF